METIIIELHVPACNGIFDFALPAALQVSEVIREMIRTIETLGQNVTFLPETTQLCDMDQYRILSAAITLAEQEVRDGSRLMLV